MTVLDQGKGPKPQLGDEVTFEYEAWLYDGQHNYGLGLRYVHDASVTWSSY